MSTCTFLIRRGWIVVLLLVTLAGYAAPAQAQGIPGCLIRITMFDALTVRSLPSFNSRITATLQRGDIVCMNGRSNDAAWVQLWRPAPTSTLVGWGQSRYFTTTVPITTLPVTDSSGPSQPPPVTSRTYVVQAGDTLSGIALRSGVTLTALAQANNVLPPYYVIYIGQVLVIPGTSGTTPPPGYQRYVVQQGDYLVSIALRYNTHWRTLATVNGIPFPYIIYPGQTLLIPASG